MSQNILQSVPAHPDPNVPQRLAASPDMDAWVEASAGSGKTKVLTDRVLRLLLPDPEGRWHGAKPHKILCITFTKAAAALMALRVQDRLAKWAVMPEADVREDLHKNLLGFAPSDDMVTVARRLFSEVLDVPGGLAIMTIHSFCQSVLSRFPLESGVAPGFRVLDETQSSSLMSDIIRRTVTDVRDGGHSSTFAASFERLSIYKDISALQEILQKLMTESWQVTEFLKGMMDADDIRRRLLSALGQSPYVTEAAIWDEAMRHFPDDDMLALSRFMTTGTALEKTAAQKLADFLAKPLSERQSQFFLLKDAVFTKEAKIRSFKTVGAGGKGPDHMLALMARLLAVITDYEQKIGILRQAEQTADLLSIASHCLQFYEQHKRVIGALDFTDMIVRTRKLLQSQSLDWVHFKLDEGIDHILVDEAQDTNGNQWEIIRLLSNEFHAGQGHKQDCPRSFFVVGDKKQSIFSFHGADPVAFEKMHGFFAARAQEGGHIFLDDRVRLETSFRTVPPILQLVDKVFEEPDLASHLGLSPSQNLIHYSHRADEAGFVELWPLIEREKPSQSQTGTDGKMVWDLPPVSYDTPTASGAVRDAGAGDSPLARQIALKIASLIESKDTFPATGQRIEPRDILILVRTRTGFVSDMVRQLKFYGIPVSGVDRLVLGDHIAVADCLALARFAKLPDDDLSLACVLKSPFVRIAEDALMALALGRGRGTLWNHMQGAKESGNLLPPDTVTWLADVIESAKFKKPFEFFDDILNRPCPHDPQGAGWRAMAQDLGEDSRDPLAEFLGVALKLEQEGIYGLEEFIDKFDKQSIQIKRDIAEGSEDSPNEVRIMTVHASKGLEAPIVFLPDTTGFPDRRKIDSLQWVMPQGSKMPLPLWSAGGSGSAVADIYKAAKEDEYDRSIAEYHRLYYVALTRARDRLYIMGENKKGAELKPLSWYALASKACHELRAAADTQTGRLKIVSEQKKPLKLKVKSELANEKPESLPVWLRQKPREMDVVTTRIINPSRLKENSQEKCLQRVVSPYETSASKSGEDRFLRGNLTHRLFQILPNIPMTEPDHRRKVAAQFLERAGSKLSTEIRADIVHEVMRILTDPVFAEVFGPQSMAEVAVTGPIGDGQVINGQIDRLVVLPDRVLIVDFKTNRPSPDNIADIPQAYRQQLAAYKAAVGRIYPERTVLCALLWTDKPFFMPVDIE